MLKVRRNMRRDSVEPLIEGVPDHCASRGMALGSELNEW